MIKRFVLVAIPALLLSVSVASANTYNFTFTGSGFSATGVLNATDLGGGLSLATSGTGTLLGGVPSPDALTLIAGGPGTFYSPSGQFIADNVLAPTAGQGQLLDGWGLLFQGTNYEVNIWGNGSDAEYSLYTNEFGTYETASGAFTLSAGGNGNTLGATPEPGFYGLLALGLGGLGFAGWRRRRA